jgi:hypothetical protein
MGNKPEERVPLHCHTIEHTVGSVYNRMMIGANEFV